MAAGEDDARFAAVPQFAALKAKVYRSVGAQGYVVRTDAFGRVNFVAAFAHAISESDTGSCHVFGLAGPWGSGKTTVLNAVARRCQVADR